MLNFRKKPFTLRNSHSLSVRLKHRYADLQTELMGLLCSMAWTSKCGMFCYMHWVDKTRPSSILGCEIPWIEELVGYSPWGSRVGCNWTHTHSLFTNVLFRCMTYHFITPLEISWYLETIIYVFLELSGQITVIGLSTPEKEMIHMSWKTCHTGIQILNISM